jgi:hypothetical protein
MRDSFEEDVRFVEKVTHISKDIPRLFELYLVQIKYIEGLGLISIMRRLNTLDHLRDLFYRMLLEQERTFPVPVDIMPQTFNPEFCSRLISFSATELKTTLYTKLARFVHSVSFQSSRYVALTKIIGHIFMILQSIDSPLNRTEPCTVEHAENVSRLMLDFLDKLGGVIPLMESAEYTTRDWYLRSSSIKELSKHVTHISPKLEKAAKLEFEVTIKENENLLKGLAAYLDIDVNTLIMFIRSLVNTDLHVLKKAEHYLRTLPDDALFTKLIPLASKYEFMTAKAILDLESLTPEHAMNALLVMRVHLSDLKDYVGNVIHDCVLFVSAVNGLLDSSAEDRKNMAPIMIRRYSKLTKSFH